MKQVAKNITFCALAFVVALWIFALWKWTSAFAAGEAEQAISGARGVILIFGVGLTIACGVLWLSAEIGALTLSHKTSMALWTTLVVAILGTSVSVYATQMTNCERKLSITRFELLELDEEERPVIPIKVRSKQLRYPSPTSSIAFVAVVGGLQLDSEGRAHLRYHFYLENPGGELAEFAHGEFQKSPQEFESRPFGQEFRKAFGHEASTVTLSFSLVERKNIGSGSCKLRLIVLDLNAGAAAEEVIDLVLARTPTTNAG